MRFTQNVHSSWIPLMYSLAYEKPMVDFLDSLKEKSIQPATKDIFRVFQMPVSDIKVVILGQEPYPIPGAANGLAYGVKEPYSWSKLLTKIRREVLETVAWTVERSGDWGSLEKWNNQGVFLLNLALTVETNKGGSHAKNWENFAKSVISFISKENPCIWLMWGNRIKHYKGRIFNPFIVENYTRETIEEIPIDPELNYIIEGENPVMGENFSNDGFYKTNRILSKKSINIINW